MLRYFRSSCIAAALTIAALTTGRAQAGVSISPFVTFLPNGSADPMAGLALAISGGPLALRASAHLSLQERSSATSAATNALATRPWGADADALAYLESYKYGSLVAFTPYVFTGVGTAATDSAQYRFIRQGWSYGAGMNAPVGSAFGLFGEVRWRMSEFVLPNSSDAPPASREFRVGVSFRIGSGGSAADIIRVIGATEGMEWGSDAPSASASRLLSTANDYVGTPYRRGGSSPSSGFDASGFVRFVFARFGITLPRSSRDQARVGEEIPANWRSIEPGDLVMFEDDGGIRHVAIYVGRARIIHSSETGGGVRYDDLTTDRGRWFLQHLAAARRISPDVRGMMLDLARGFSSDNTSDEPDHAPRAPMRRRN